jgi:Na+/proline symporter
MGSTFLLGAWLTCSALLVYEVSRIVRAFRDPAAYHPASRGGLLRTTRYLVVFMAWLSMTFAMLLPHPPP